jgi:hypothetical protein
MTERYAHLAEQPLRDPVELFSDTAADTCSRDEQKSQWVVQVSNLRPPAVGCGTHASNGSARYASKPCSPVSFSL